MSTHLSIERMNDLLDGLLPAAEADAARAHLDACGVCRQDFAVLSETVAELRTLPRDARPPEHLWGDIEARIQGRPAVRAEEETATVLAFPGTPAAPPARRGILLSVPQLAAAAAVVALVSAGLVYSAVSGGGMQVTPAQAPEQGPVIGPAARAASSGSAGYDQAIADLEALVERGRETLSPETVATLEASLASIDQALADVRDALRDDPSSELLMSMLVGHQTSKLRVLRQAAAGIQGRT